MTAEGGPIGVRWAVIPGEDGSREVSADGYTSY